MKYLKLQSVKRRHPQRSGLFFISLLSALSSLLLFCSPPAQAMARRPPVTDENSKARGERRAAPPLTLEECYSLALKRSETVLIQKEDIKEAEAQFFKAAGEALGDVDFVMTYSKQKELPAGEGGVSGSFTDPDRRERKFVIKQPLFRGFRALGALVGAGSLKKQQKEEWIRAKQLLFLDVADAFYGLLHEKKNLQITDGIYRLYRARIRELVARERIGRSRASELASAKSRMKEIKAERARTRAAHAIAQDLLEFLTGIEIQGRKLQEEELPREAIREINDYLQKVQERSDVEAAKQSMKTASQGVVVAQSGFWPEVNLEHNRYNRREGLQSDIDWDLLFTVNVPLFHGGETVGKVKEAISRWKKEKLNYSYARRKAELEVKQAYQSWVSSVEETRALQEAVKASEENFRLQRDDYTHSLVSNLDVLAALESLHRTRLDANRAYFQMKENYWGLQTAAGAGPFDSTS